MNWQIRQYSSDDSKLSSATTGDNSGAAGSVVSGSRGAGDTKENSDTTDVYDERGPIGDRAVGESGVPGRGYDVGTLAGTDWDKTGLGENMATES